LEVLFASLKYMAMLYIHHPNIHKGLDPSPDIKGLKTLGFSQTWQWKIPMNLMGD
jgi:hypothetical protein